MNYIAQCLEKFRGLPPRIRDVVGGIDSLVAIRELEEKYGVSLSFTVVLVAIGELSLETLPDYLSTKFSFSEEDADELTEDLIDKIFANLLEKEVEILNKEELGEVLRGSFQELFEDQNQVALVNNSIFMILAQDGLAATYLEKCLLENSTEFIKAKLILENKSVESTVGNWILDFIKFNGSDMFDDLALAEYLSKSENAKTLNDQDKKTLSRLIKTYRNLFFFLEETDKKPISDWEIIPLDDLEEKDQQEKSFLEKKDDNLRRGLEESLRGFQKGTLEYRAASEELERLNKISN